MGVLYSVLPVSEETGRWLRDDLGLEVSDVDNRIPTLDEIRDSLNTIGAHFSEAATCDEVELEIEREAEWTRLRVTKEKSGPPNICFSKGHEDLIKAICTELSRRTGSLIVVSDTDGEPWEF